MQDKKNLKPTRAVSPEALAKGLADHAKTNPVFSAMAAAFATRERTRAIITTDRLAKAMKTHGFDFSKEAYRKELEFMASLGLGSIVHTPNGHVRALKDIKVTLQSVGKAALDQSKTLDQYAGTKNMYSKLITKEQAAAITPKRPNAPEVHKNPLRSVSIRKDSMVFEFDPAANIQDSLQAAVDIYETVNKRAGK